MRVVFWTKQAQTDLAAIRAFISQDSPHYGSVVVSRLISATDRCHFQNRAGPFRSSTIRWFARSCIRPTASSIGSWASTRYMC